MRKKKKLLIFVVLVSVVVFVGGCECGDNILDSGEECDDGNTDNGDGCSSVCKVEECTTDSDCDDNNKCTNDNCDSNYKCVNDNPFICGGSCFGDCFGETETCVGDVNGNFFCSGGCGNKASQGQPLQCGYDCPKKQSCLSVPVIPDGETCTCLGGEACNPVGRTEEVGGEHCTYVTQNDINNYPHIYLPSSLNNPATGLVIRTCTVEGWVYVESKVPCPLCYECVAGGGSAICIPISGCMSL